MAAFNVEGARAAGYTDAEIVAHLTKSRPFNVEGARKAGYSDGEIISHLLTPAPAKSGADLIPGQGPEGKPAPAPSVAQQVVGAGEATLAGVSAIAAYLNGLAGGGNVFVKRLLAEATGQPNPEQYDPGKAYEQAAQAVQYVPKTEAGQTIVRDVVEPAGQFLAPLAGLGGEMAALAQAGRAARTGAPAATAARAAAEGTARDLAGAPGAAAAAGAIDATTNAARVVQRTATTLPKRAWAAISRDEPATPTPGTMGSAGAAATDIARQRVATAEQLGFTGDAALTKGQATRDAAQLKFEVETAKNPEQGAALRQRKIAQNDMVMRNIDTAFDQTGAEAPSLRAVGQVVDEALVRQYKADQAAVKAAYQKALRSAEADKVVDNALPVTIGEGERQITGTPLTWINAQPTGVPAVQLIDAARQYAVKLGIAEMRDGELVPRPATVRQMEEWRTAIGQATGYEAPEIRQSTILKALIDAKTEPLAGPDFRYARNLRRRVAENYEDRAAVAKLLNDKKGMGDRQVALEDVFQHSIVKGSLDDVRNIRRVLHRSGEQGQQAWRELQGATLQWMKGKAGLDQYGVAQRVTTDSAGRAVLSPEGLNAAVRELDVDGRLDFIFGKRGAQRLRDINEIAQVAKTVPPEAAINFSNTATTWMAAVGDVGVTAMTGVPAPLATATRLGLKHIKDAKVRKRVTEALRGIESNNTP